MISKQRLHGGREPAWRSLTDPLALAAQRPLERAGGFKKHLKSFPEYEDLATDLKKRFKFVGDSGVYHFLWTVKHPVPEWRDWSRAHGMNW